MNEPRSDWTVVLPLKGGPSAKSRLGAPAPVATAIALDCLEAVLASELVRAVVVVTPDPGLAAEAAAAGAQVRPESLPGAGLLAALQDGLAGVPGPCAVLLGDLPALRPEDLSSALHQAATALTPPGSRAAGSRAAGSRADRARNHHPTAAPSMVFVPDADDIGTVLLAALSAGAMIPSFGPGSAGAHQAAGAVRLDVDLPRLRRDVDTPADLRAAMTLGLGPRTRAVLSWLTENAEPAGNIA
jgi:2-phospho-L-lactate guanylyltransferase